MSKAFLTQSSSEFTKSSRFVVKSRLSDPTVLQEAAFTFNNEKGVGRYSLLTFDTKTAW